MCNTKSRIKLRDNYGISVQRINKHTYMHIYKHMYVCFFSTLLLNRWPADEHRSSSAAAATYYRCFRLNASLHAHCMHRCPPTPFWQHLTVRIFCCYYHFYCKFHLFYAFAKKKNKITNINATPIVYKYSKCCSICVAAKVESGKLHLCIRVVLNLKTTLFFYYLGLKQKS